MTLAEQLRDIWRRLGNAEDWSDQHIPLDELAALANEVEGKVLVKPCEVKSRPIFNAYNGSVSTHFPTVLNDVVLGIRAVQSERVQTGAEALADLQRKIDDANLS